ncbi:MAG TPA: hypothetical protein VIV65_10165 [Gemmatimonadaceae bacterium]|jgi:Trk-type K+ transport system membrane component
MHDIVFLIPILGIIGGCSVIITAMNLIARHISEGRQLEMRAMPNDEIMQRLERIEQIVDTTAVEVERLAESNRFVAKLLAERAQTPSA